MEGERWGAVGGYGLLREARREGLDGANRGICDGIWHEVRGVVKGCTERRQMVSTGRGGGGGIHAEIV